MKIGPETRCNEKDYVYAAKPGVTRSCDEFPDLSLAADTESKGGEERIAEACEDETQNYKYAQRKRISIFLAGLRFRKKRDLYLATRSKRKVLLTTFRK